jgi:glycosyltransferase involved in cell wall biosynthesis
MNQRLACYGYIEKGTGSLAGAHFLVLEELLKRGYEIDWYGWAGFTEPHQLSIYPNYRFIQLPSHSLDLGRWKFLPKILQKGLSDAFTILLAYARNANSLREYVIREHQTRCYSSFLVMGLASPCEKIPNLPTISWLQGHPLTEWDYIHQLRGIITKSCGKILYWKLFFFYLLKNKRYRFELKQNDALICGSQWSRNKILSCGVSAEKIFVLPYPVDLTFFKPSDNKDEKKSVTFLWLGRIDPRKRLDLLLKAYEGVVEELRMEFPMLKLKVIGRIPYAQGYESLIKNFKYPDYLEYLPSISRDQIPELFQNTNYLVQPSEGENFGTAVAESLASGIPVILGSSNGTQEFISESSFIFNEYTPESLRSIMISAARKSYNGEVMGDCVKTAQKNFSTIKVTDQLQNFLDFSPESEDSYQLVGLQR